MLSLSTISAKFLLSIDLCDLSPADFIFSFIFPELEELRDLTSNGKGKLVEIQQRESEETGIPSLKIGFNNVFGYYL